MEDFRTSMEPAYGSRSTCRSSTQGAGAPFLGIRTMFAKNSHNMTGGPKMKCLRYADGTIRRVRDWVAEEAVSAGKAEFCSKADWKSSDAAAHAQRAAHEASLKAEKENKKNARPRISDS